ncbi:unnamed protein product [Caenorhabditis bovis]|uniref:Uncharacterized protein n=1 Tax=Caenorhabditis bovis TaxID=2654633 RepID=A0A8S1F723_9PELO|nr:unnamed protein product [Caenorhabditis bovis]
MSNCLNMSSEQEDSMARSMSTVEEFSKRGAAKNVTVRRTRQLRVFTEKKPVEKNETINAKLESKKNEEGKVEFKKEEIKKEDVKEKKEVKIVAPVSRVVSPVPSRPISPVVQQPVPVSTPIASAQGILRQPNGAGLMSVIKKKFTDAKRKLSSAIGRLSGRHPPDGPAHQ